MDETELQVAEEELLTEAGLAPRLLPRLFGYFPGLAFVDVCQQTDALPSGS